MKRIRVLTLCCTVVLAAGVAGCGGSDGDATTPTSTETVVTDVPSTSTTPSEGSPATTDATRAQQAATFTVAFRDGTVTGDTAPSVERGERVSITVTSDIADEIHLHGYDILRELSPGRPETLTFTADIPGKFELEFHHNPTRLLTLTVR